jgi:ketosteroid isomerase-like protein
MHDVGKACNTLVAQVWTIKPGQIAQLDEWYDSRAVAFKA